MNTEEFLNGLSAEQQEELLKKLAAKKQQSELDKRNAYEGIRDNFAKSVKDKVVELSLRVKDFRDWLDKEGEGFKEVMAEYGKLRNKDQRGYTLVVGDFKFEEPGCEGIRRTCRAGCPETDGFPWCLHREEREGQG